MKFTRSSIPTGVIPNYTPTRLENAARSLARQRESWGMFPEMASQATPQERLDRFDEELRAMWRRLRHLEAECWCSARAFLRIVSPEEKAEFLNSYHRLLKKFPAVGTGAYFSSLLGNKFPEYRLAQLAKVQSAMARPREAEA